MKRNLLLFISIFFTLSVSAQDIPNKGFENWTSSGSYEDPDGWATLNSLSAFQYPITVTKSTDKNTGTYAIRLESKSFTNYFSNTPKPDTITGIASSGTSKVLGVNDIQLFGFPYNQRPASLTGYHKYTPSSLGKDSGIVFVALTLWNTTKKQRDTIALGSFAQKNKIEAYTKFNAKLYYSNISSNPDSAIIILSSSNVDHPKSGSVLLIDDLAFDGATGIFGARPSYNNIIVYPNPANTETHLKNLPADASFIELTDFTGKPVGAFSISPNEDVEIKTQNYNSGIYLYNIRNNQGERIAAGKFTVVK